VNCLIADDPHAMQDAALRLVDDTALRRRLGTRGRSLIMRKYQWTPVGKALHQLVDDALARGGR
jgi:glycosyltransferase involved in cell wall biosynthesis